MDLEPKQRLTIHVSPGLALKIKRWALDTNKTIGEVIEEAFADLEQEKVKRGHKANR